LGFMRSGKTAFGRAAGVRGFQIFISSFGRELR
jgi:hypothetical protein